MSPSHLKRNYVQAQDSYPSQANSLFALLGLEGPNCTLLTVHRPGQVGCLCSTNSRVGLKGFCNQLSHSLNMYYFQPLLVLPSLISLILA